MKFNYYVTFGQEHTHSVDGVTIDKNSVVAFKGGYSDVRKFCIETFGNKWCFLNEFNAEDISRYYSRGVVLSYDVPE